MIKSRVESSKIGGRSNMLQQDKINDLYEQLIHLDEIAGQLDPETNARIDAQRVALRQQILHLENTAG